VKKFIHAMWILICGVSLFILVGCASPMQSVRSVETKVAIPLIVKAPRELYEPIINECKGDICFYDIRHPERSSCLTPETEKKLKKFMYELHHRVNQWEVWGMD